MASWECSLSDSRKIKLTLQQTKLSLLERIFSYLRSFDLPSSQYTLSRLEKYLNATTSRINSLSIPEESMFNLSKSYNISLITSQDSPRTPTKIPDHAVDRRTKLFHLTPPGRAQVTNFFPLFNPWTSPVGKKCHFC